MELVIAPPPVADFYTKNPQIVTSENLLNELIINYEDRIKNLTQRVTNLLTKLDKLENQKCSKKHSTKKRKRKFFDQEYNQKIIRNKRTKLH